MGATIKRKQLPSANRRTRTIRENRLDASLNKIPESGIHLCDRGKHNRQKKKEKEKDDETGDD